jgi:hypothetical protein
MMLENELRSLRTGERAGAEIVILTARRGAGKRAAPKNVNRKSTNRFSLSIDDLLPFASLWPNLIVPLESFNQSENFC